MLPKRNLILKGSVYIFLFYDLKRTSQPMADLVSSLKLTCHACTFCKAKQQVVLIAFYATLVRVSA